MTRQIPFPIGLLPAEALGPFGVAETVLKVLTGRWKLLEGWRITMTTF